MNSFQLEYQLTGCGKPIIVIETGLGCSFYDWQYIIEQLSTQVRFLTYHRSGYGNSPQSQSKRSTGQIAIELNILLRQLDIIENIILIGHSFGGLCVQHFASLFPQNLIGVILVDSTSVNYQQLDQLQLPIMQDMIAMDKFILNWVKTAKQSRDQIKSTFDTLLSPEQLTLSKETQNKVIDFKTSPSLYASIVSEAENWEVSSREIKSGSSFPQIPLIVLARDSETAVRFWVEQGIPESEAIIYEATWRKLQKEHANLSNQGKLIIAEGSDHEIHVEKPQYIIDTINDMLKL